MAVKNSSVAAVIDIANPMMCIALSDLVFNMDLQTVFSITLC